jgi:hypothetical protein
MYANKNAFGREGKLSGFQWLIPVILATWEAEIGEVEV